MSKFEKPDWSLAAYNIRDTDIGWAKGALPDGRPYFLEMWRDGNSELATFYFSPCDLTQCPHEHLLRLFIDADIIALIDEPIPLDANIVTDSIGQNIYSLNVVLRDSTGEYASLKIPIEKFTHR